VTAFPILLALGLAAGAGSLSDAVPLPAGASPPAAESLAPAPSDAPADVTAVDAGTFVQRVLMANDFEIMTSRIAAERSPTDAVRAYARRIIADHEEVGRRLGAIVVAGGIGADATGAVETTDPKLAAALNGLGTAEGEAFDELYLELQADAHGEAIRLYTAYAESGGNAELRDFAVSTLPSLQKHQLDVAELQK
jgi:putative membrane protein